MLPLRVVQARDGAGIRKNDAVRDGWRLTFDAYFSAVVLFRQLSYPLTSRPIPNANVPRTPHGMRLQHCCCATAFARFERPVPGTSSSSDRCSLSLLYSRHFDLQHPARDPSIRRKERRQDASKLPITTLSTTMALCLQASVDPGT